MGIEIGRYRKTFLFAGTASRCEGMDRTSTFFRRDRSLARALYDADFWRDEVAAKAMGLLPSLASCFIFLIWYRSLARRPASGAMNWPRQVKAYISQPCWLLHILHVVP
jgi:hypothetical protein